MDVRKMETELMPAGLCTTAREPLNKELFGAEKKNVIHLN